MDRYVETYTFPDGQLDVCWTGLSLPYRAFDPDQQRVTHAAITENKRLSAVLEAIKAAQDAQPPKIPAAGKQRTKYQPTGKRRRGAPSILDKRAARKADETARGSGPGSNP